jgi:glycosyltransferase involved in cell wall biosynthesis
MARSLEILNKSDDRYRILVVGDGRYAAEARALFARHGQTARVSFAGRLPLTQARSAYGAIDLAVYPRDRTNVTAIVESLKPVEALAAGVPVVVSSLPPLQALIERCPGVFAAEPFNAEDLAEKIRAFFDRSPDERTAMGRAAQDWVARNRSWDRTVRLVAEAYADVGVP